MQTKANNTLLIYVSYASEDKRLWEALHAHMSALRYYHIATHIYDARNSSQTQTHHYLEHAHIFLLLLSPNFIQSSLCTQEMEYALTRYRTRAAWIIPIRLRPLPNWSSLPIGALEAIPPQRDQSVQEARHRDAIFTTIVEKICTIAETLGTSDLMTFTPESPLIDTPPPLDLNLISPRTETVEKIYKVLTSPGISGLFLTGLRGIGKTRLATLVYHYTEQMRSSGNGIFSGQSIWLEISTTTTLIDIAAALCHNLNRTIPNIWKLSPPMLAQELFRLLDTLTHPCLIICDQFEALLDVGTGRPRNPQDGIAALLQLLANRPCRSRLLLVSRFIPWGMPPSPPLYLQEFEVPPLEKQEGLALLRLWGVQGHRDVLERAVEYCQGHIQAIVYLQAVLKLDSNVSLSSLFYETAHKQRWIGSAARDFLEYCYMHQLNSEQRLLLRSFSIYRQPVSQDAVLEMLRIENQAFGLLGSTGRRKALDVLLSLKLLYPRPTRLYNVPPVVAETISACFQQEDDHAFRQAHACAAHYYIWLASNSRRNAQPKNIGDMYELVEATWHLCQAQLYEQASKLWQEEHLYSLLRNWGESTLLKEIYQLFLQWQEGISPTIYNESGEIAMMQGQTDEAREYFTFALSLCSTESPDEEQVTFLSNSGAAYRKLGQLEDAQRQYLQALSICEQGAMTAEAQGVILNNLGRLLYEQGYQRQTTGQIDDPEEYTFAISYYERALTLYQQENLTEEAVRTLNNLGDAYSVCQHNEKAKNYYCQAFLLSQQIGARWAQAVSLGNLGLLYREEANFEQAQACYEQALRIFHQIGSSWEEATLLRNLGTLYLLKHRYDVALACFILARDMFIALQHPINGKIPTLIEDELRLVLHGISYEEWFQSIEPQAILLLEQSVYDAPDERFSSPFPSPLCT